MSSQNFAEIAKEITIAAIDKGVFRPVLSATLSNEQLNEINARELGKFTKTIFKSVNEAYQGNFDSKTE